MAEAADKNVLTDEQLHRVINMLLRPKGDRAGAKKAFDPAKEPTDIRDLAKSFKGGMQSLDKQVGRLGISDLVTKGALGAADLTNQYAKDAFKSNNEFKDTFSFGGDPNAEGTLWPAGSGVLLGSGTRIAAKTLPEALKALSPVEKSAVVGAKAGTYGSWLKDHLKGAQDTVDDAVLKIGKSISEQSGYVQERLKKLMGDKAFNWAKQQNKPAFSPQSMNDPKFGPTMKALGGAGIKLPGQQQGGGKGPGEIGSMLGIFAGPYGATNLAKAGYPQPQQALEMAKKMESEGAPLEEIYAKTSELLKTTPFAGITRTKDGQFRFEIPDNEMKIKKTDSSGPMDQIISHPLFFMAYPKMKDRNVSIGEKKTGVAYAAGGYNPGDGNIAIDNPESNADSDLQVLAHEMNHAAQHFEGDLFAGTIAPGKPTVAQITKYHQQPSEAEAEESAHRQSWPPERRKAMPPGYSFPGGADKERPPWMVKSADQLIKPGQKAWWLPWMGEEPKIAKPKVSENPPESIVELTRKLRDAYRRQLAKDTGKTVASP